MSLQFTAQYNEPQYCSAVLSVSQITVQYNGPQYCSAVLSASQTTVQKSHIVTVRQYTTWTHCLPSVKVKRPSGFVVSGSTMLPHPLSAQCADVPHRMCQTALFYQ